jgi:intracellular septation protein
MKILFDFLPLLLFFAAFRLGGVYVATAVTIAATLGQVLWLKVRRHAVPPALWLSLGVVVVFGGATLVLRDDWFLKMKPTAFYWLMAGTLLTGRFLGRDLPRVLLGEHLQMPPAGWRLMTSMWTVFFAAMGAANLYVARTFPTETWVNFKVFWSTGLFVAFSVIQALMLSPYLPEEAKTQEPGNAA